ncbi:MAG: hypothetical protein HKM04_06485 [Legionellales bacterium]|nr:hypothetical protein [Legionellales bacterium]
MKTVTKITLAKNKLLRSALAECVKQEYSLRLQNQQIKAHELNDIADDFLHNLNLSSAVITENKKKINYPDKLAQYSIQIIKNAQLEWAQDSDISAQTSAPYINKVLPVIEYLVNYAALTKDSESTKKLIQTAADQFSKLIQITSGYEDSKDYLVQALDTLATATTPGLDIQCDEAIKLLDDTSHIALDSDDQFTYANLSKDILSKEAEAIKEAEEQLSLIEQGKNPNAKELNALFASFPKS